MTYTNKKAILKIRFSNNFNNSLKEIGLNLLSLPYLKKNKISQIALSSKFELELPCELSFENLTSDQQVRIKVGAFSYLHPTIHIQSSVKIGRYCSIADGVKLGLILHPTDRLSTSPYFYSKNWYVNWNKGFGDIEPFQASKVTIIGHDVWIGSNALIMGGINIGDGAIIGAGAIITKDVPSYAIVIKGNEILRYRTRPKEFGKQKNWWNYNQVTGKKLQPKIINTRSIKELEREFFKSRFSKFFAKFKILR